MTTKDILNWLLAELDETTFTFYGDEVEPKVEVFDTRTGHIVKIKGPGGRFSIGIGKHGIMISESPASNAEWVDQVEKVIKRVDKRVNAGGFIF